VVKSYNKERMKENLQIFDWELSEDDHNKISQIKQHRMMRKEELVSARGPYKSVVELWDGELLRLNLSSTVLMPSFFIIKRLNFTVRICT
jgi:hypothetical protein